MPDFETIRELGNCQKDKTAINCNMSENNCSTANVVMKFYEISTDNEPEHAS